MHPCVHTKAGYLVAVKPAFVFEKCALEINTRYNNHHLALHSELPYSPDRRYTRTLPASVVYIPVAFADVQWFQ